MARNTEKTELTPRNAAMKLAKRLDATYQLIWAGQLKARKSDGRWLVSAASVEERLKKQEARKNANTHR